LAATVDTTFGNIAEIIDGSAPRRRPLYASIFEDTLIDDDGRVFP
jgi:hypothetical protein